MKKTFSAILFIIATVFSIHANTNIDLTKSQIEWTGKKVTGSHHGTVSLLSGNLEMVNNEISSGSFVIDMNSIVCTDIENKDSNLRLINHLKNDDFFSVEKFPTSNITINKVVLLKDNNQGWTHNIYADLTIKGITKEIIFPSKIKSESKGKSSVYAEITVDRTQYDIRYMSSSFFSDLANKAIDNDLYFKVKLFTK